MDRTNQIYMVYLKLAEECELPDCNCGGPQEYWRVEGHKHAPGCVREMAEERLWDEAEEILWEAEEGL